MLRNDCAQPGHPVRAGASQTATGVKLNVSGPARQIPVRPRSHVVFSHGDVCNLQARLAEARQAASDRQQLLHSTAEIVTAITQAGLVAWYSSASERIGEQPQLETLSKPTLVLDQRMRTECLRVARAAAETSTTATHSSAAPEMHLVSVPIPQAPQHCLLALFGQTQQVSATAVVVLQLAAAHIASWQLACDLEESELESRQLAALTDLIARVEASDAPDQACQVLVNELPSYLECEQVIAGLCRPGTLDCRVVAISGADTVDSGTEHVRLAQAVLQESIARGELSIWPPSGDDDRQGLLAHRQYLSPNDGEALISSPLRDSTGKVCGAWLLAGREMPLRQPRAVNFIRAAESPLASALQLITRAQQGWILQACAASRRFLGQHRGRATLVAIGLACLAMLVPVKYRAKCDCQLEPVVRRFVAAPFDGPLEKAFVEPGDVVTKDQLLARIDGREIRWELAGTQADLHRATKQRDGHVAEHEVGEAQIAKHEVSRLQLRTELLEHRSGNLEIRSPIDGMVVSGNLQEAEGMPLTVGTTLFEIAPLDQMVVELAVHEDDIASVRTGMPVRMQFDAFPLRRFQATVQRIHPRAELIESENVFIAEVRLDNNGRELRPGMRGQARIEAGRFPLGWNLFRRPVAAALAWLGW